MLAELADTLNRHRQWRLLFTAGIAGSLWIYILILNYKVVLPHNDADFLLHALEGLPNLIEHPGLVRPTTFLDLWNYGELHLKTATDWFFLVVLPSLMIAFVLIALWLALKPPAANLRQQLLKVSVVCSSLFCIAITVWIVGTHPPLSREETAERYRIAAISKWLKAPAHLKKPQEFLEKSEEHDPSSAETWRIRGDFAFMQGDWIKADEMYQQAIKHDTRTPARLQQERVRLILQKKGPVQENNPEVLHHILRGYALMDFQKKPLEALDEFKTALQLDPASPYAPGLTALLRQNSRQSIRMRGAGSQLAGISPVSWMMLGTRINEVRLTVPLFQRGR